MPRRQPFDVLFDTLVVEHLDGIESEYHSPIRRAIAEQLTHDPDVPTRNRKPLLRGTALGATWELRCGPDNRVRVFYDIHREQRLVVVLAIGHKVGNRLLVGKEKLTP